MSTMVVPGARSTSSPPAVLPSAGSLASRRAVARWSDGTEGEAARWDGDQVFLTEGDLIGKTQAQIRSLHFRRERDWLRS